MELQRNRLLREQLKEDMELPEVCEVDWKASYEKLSDCNKELEVALRQQAKTAEEDAQPLSVEPVAFEVTLPDSDSSERVEVVGFRSPKNAAFYLLRGRLPLGLQLTKKDEGRLKGAFMVEAAAPGGAAANGGVIEGDILHELTVVMDRANLGIKTEDFVSSVVGGLGRWRQTIMDASYINTVDDLVSQFKSNTMLGSDTEFLLIFERDISTSPAPAEQRVSSGRGATKSLAWRAWSDF